MTIEVKGTRSNPQAEPAAEKFDFFNAKQRLTMLPVHFGVVIIVLALYIRRFFDPAVSEAVSEPSGGKGKPDEGPDELKMRERADEREHPSQDEPSKSGRVPEFADDAGQPIDWSPSIFLAEATPPIQFTRFTFEVAGLDAFPAAYGIGSSNDNRRPYTPGNVIDFPPVAGPSVPVITKPGGVTPEKPTDEDTETDPDTSPEVTTPNRAPKTSGPVRLNDVFAGQAVLFGLSHLLWGAMDPDGDQLAIGNMSADVLSIAAIGSGWRVTTEPGMLGPVTLTYSITDGEAVVWQTAHFEIVRKSQTLTPGDDLFVGSPYDDDIDGLAGDDIIDAMGGNDIVVGGAGDDHIIGGEGNDVLHGDGSDDMLFGGMGNDILYGGAGADRLFGDQGDDTVYGEDGDDYLDGGTGNDILDGGTGHDFLTGGLGNDALVGGTGNDSLYGNEGNDVLDAGLGDDYLDGGTGNDILIDGAGADTVVAGEGDDIVIGGAGDDSYAGGDGYDVLDYSQSAEDLLIHTGTGEASGDSIGDDQFDGFEEVIGGSGDDLFVITGSAHVLAGGRGRDTFVFEVTDDRPSLSDDLVHDILDFVVGDRVRVRDYDISREARTAERDMFRSVYGDDDDDWLSSEFPLLVTHEQVDGVDVTIVTADINGDAIMDLTLNIFGLHLGYAADTISA